MSPLAVILLAVAGWVALVLFARWVAIPYFERGPGGDAVNGMLWRLVRVYCRLFHRAEFRGEADLRDHLEPGAMIVVSNHTSAVDPLLIQAACRFHIRWLMAADMMIPELDWLWKNQDIIPVARDGTDARPLREAIRHVRSGGVIGIFPEGGIVEPRGEVRPFLAGVGFLIARTRAPVLLAWVSGTPEREQMSSAFVVPSRSRVEFVGLREFADIRDPEEITRRLREKFAAISGWSLSEQPMPGARRVETSGPAKAPSAVGMIPVAG